MSDASPRLEPREQALLDFERQWAGAIGGKRQAIRERFAISAARYYQLLNRTMDRPAAMDYDPLLVRRLRRRRDERARRRTTSDLRRPQQR